MSGGATYTCFAETVTDWGLLLDHFAVFGLCSMISVKNATQLQGAGVWLRSCYFPARLHPPWDCVPITVIPLMVPFPCVYHILVCRVT